MAEDQIVNNVNAEEQESVNASNDAETATATQNPPAGNGHSPEPQTAHDDFDWTIDKRNVSAYSKE